MEIAAVAGKVDGWLYLKVVGKEDEKRGGVWSTKETRVREGGGRGEWRGRGGGGGGGKGPSPEEKQVETGGRSPQLPPEP